MTDTSFQANPDNFCYRHPDRQSLVLCQRCLRTICPECQTQMPVGVICPECLAEQQKQQQATVTRMPRRRGSSRGGASVRVSSGTPVVTYTIMGVTIFFYLLGMVPGLSLIHI